MSISVCFTMDNLGDAADLHRGVIQNPRKSGESPYIETGFPAMLDLYSKYSIPITHFIEGWSAREYPEQIARLLDSGYDIGMHGWQHEIWQKLELSEATRLAHIATEAIRTATGMSPRAFRAPGGYCPDWFIPVLEDLGYQINASLNAEQNTHLNCSPASSKITNIPYNWDGVDATHWLWSKLSCAEVENLWLSRLQQLSSENSHFVFIWHPHVMGIDPEKLAVGERIIQFVQNSAEFEIVSLDKLLASTCRAVKMMPVPPAHD